MIDPKNDELDNDELNDEEIDETTDLELDESFDLDLDGDDSDDSDEIKEEDKAKDAAAFKQKAEGQEKSSHKKYKKHSLGYDSIFKGRKETLDPDGLDELDAMLVPDRIEIMQGTIVFEESRNPEEYNRLKKLTETVYNILLNQTELNFKKNRRKPSPKDFNRYFEIIKEHVDDNAFSDCDIFVELAFYFSENLFNMFKLLDPEKGSRIMNELKEYKSKKNGADLDDMDFI